MKNTKLLLALLGFAAVLSAADHIVGTWKMNAAKTKYKTGTAPKEQTVTISESGSDMITKVDGTAADGTKIAITYSMPTAGGTGKIISSSAYDGVSGKLIGTNEREIHYMKGGKDVYTAHSKLSADGKTLTVNTKGTNALGQNVEAAVVYDKQK
jgi:hypothetical protein